MLFPRTIPDFLTAGLYYKITLNHINQLLTVFTILNKYYIGNRILFNGWKFIQNLWLISYTLMTIDNIIV